MRFKEGLQQLASNFRLMAAIGISLSVALPLAVYQSSQWRNETKAYAREIENEKAAKEISAQALDHIQGWSAAKLRMPLTESVTLDADAVRDAQMRVNIENQRMSRVEVDRVLDGLSQNTEGIFMPEAFMVRAEKAGDEIFVKNSAEDSADSLVLTIKGETVPRAIQ